jgi:predicted phage terminase large subunit-like protein
VARASVIEPVFEVGHVLVPKTNWTQTCLDEMASFPQGHDDQVSSLLATVEDILAHWGRLSLSRG